MSGRDDYEERRNMRIDRFLARRKKPEADSDARFNAAHKMSGASLPTNPLSPAGVPARLRISVTGSVYITTSKKPLKLPTLGI